MPTLRFLSPRLAKRKPVDSRLAFARLRAREFSGRTVFWIF